MTTLDSNATSAAIAAPDDPATVAHDAIARIVAEVDAHATPASYARAARALAAHAAALTPIRVALLSSFTINPFAPYLAVEFARAGFAADIHIGAFHSVQQELLDAGSGTARHRPDVIIIAELLEDLSPALTHDFLTANAEARRASSAEIVDSLANAMRAFRTRQACAFVVHNYMQPAAPLLGLAEPMSEDTQFQAVHALNSALAALARGLSDVFVLDFNHVCATVGYSRWRDDRSWYLGHAPLSATVSVPLAREHARVVQALKGPPRKCLMVDLDNTLWGGIVGEDGPAGIAIGSGYPGNVFLDFQRLLLQLRDRGVMLAINSKNNEADVLEAFRERREMPLALHHFAATRMNWLDKAANAASLAAELNIGVNSLVFFDDNPAERARMREALPEVLTLDVPADPMRYVELLQATRPFDRLFVSEEDRKRGAMQQQARARSAEAAASGSMDDFLRRLEMKVSVRGVDGTDAPRVVDLLRKTNQFNVTTRRYSAAQLDEMLQDGQAGVFSLRATDRFGDHGLVGVAIARVEAVTTRIDSFLLSCRVIGRGVESALLAHVADWARERGCSTLVGEFLPTAKNAPAASLFPQHHFVTAGESANGTRWTLDLSGAEPAWPSHIAGNAHTPYDTTRQTAPQGALATTEQ